MVVGLLGPKNQIGGRAIGREGDIVNRGDAHQGFDVRIMRLGAKRIPKEDDDINFAGRDFRATF